LCALSLPRLSGVVAALCCTSSGNEVLPNFLTMLTRLFSVAFHPSHAPALPHSSGRSAAKFSDDANASFFNSFPPFHTRPPFYTRPPSTQVQPSVYIPLSALQHTLWSPRRGLACREACSLGVCYAFSLPPSTTEHCLRVFPCCWRSKKQGEVLPNFLAMLMRFFQGIATDLFGCNYTLPEVENSLACEQFSYSSESFLCRGRACRKSSRYSVIFS
jgi:hypothetical protein